MAKRHYRRDVEKKPVVHEETRLFCERSLCGCVLVDAGRSLKECASVGLSEDDFSNDTCRMLFQTVRGLVDAGKPADPMIVGDTRKFTSIQLQAFMDGCATSAHAGYYAQKVKFFSRCCSAMSKLKGFAESGNWSAMSVALQECARDSVLSASGSLSVNVGGLLGYEPPPPKWILDGIFEKGNKVLVVGSSKTRKSFFAIQLALCVSAGLPFVGIDIATPRRVLLVNLENPEEWEHRRILKMSRTMQVDDYMLGDRFWLTNGRGKFLDLKAIKAEAMQHRADVIVLDPLYKLDGGADECDMQERKRLIEDLERVSAETGAAIVYVHHDAKGNAGDRDIRDRGAGSSIINRDVDATLALTAWGDKKNDNYKNLTVLSRLARNSPQCDDITIEFSNNTFVLREEIEPFKATSKTVSESRKSVGNDKEDAKELATMSAMGDAVSMSELRDFGVKKFGDKRCRRAINFLIENVNMFGVSMWRDPKNKRGFVGLSSAIGRRLEELKIDPESGEIIK